MESGKGTGNIIKFTFRVEDDDLDYSFEEEIEVEDFNEQEDCIRALPSMNCNEAPFMHLIQSEQVDEADDDDDEEEEEENCKNNCCSNILLVDDNYFNIEVLQSLIIVQLRMKCDSAFNGQEAVDKVIERSKKTC